MDERKLAASLAASALLTPFNIVVTIIVILVAGLIFIIWRRRNRRKNKGNSVYLFH